jgi:hypothetical protein
MNKQPIIGATKLEYWLALTFVKDIGPTTVKRLPWSSAC